MRLELNRRAASTGHGDLRSIEFVRQGFAVDLALIGDSFPRLNSEFRCALFMIAVNQESIPWQSFVFDAVRPSTIRNTSLDPPQKGARAVAIFISDNPAWAEVCLNSSS